MLAPECHQRNPHPGRIGPSNRNDQAADDDADAAAVVAAARAVRHRFRKPNIPPARPLKAPPRLSQGLLPQFMTPRRPPPSAKPSTK